MPLKRRSTSRPGRADRPARATAANLDMADALPGGLHSADATVLHDAGLAALARGDLAEAETLFRTAARMHGGDPAIATGRGRALAGLGRAEEAMAAYNRALTLAPTHADAHYHAGQLLAASGLPDEALIAIGRAVALRPQWAGAHALRGTLLRRLRRHEDALAAFAQALLLDPDLRPAASERAALLREMGRASEAEAALRAILAAHADDADALATLGALLATQGRAEEALPLLQDAVVRHPGSAANRLRLGVALLAAGRDGAARAALESVLDIDPDCVEARIRFAVALARLGDDAAAIEALRQALAIRPDDRDAIAELAELLARRCDWDAAEATYRRALDHEPLVDWATSRLGDLLCRAGRLADAERVYRTALAREPARPELLAALGIVLESAGRLAEAEQCHREAIDLMPGHQPALAGLGSCLARQRRLAESEACYRAAIAAEPGDCAAWSGLGTVLRMAGRPAEAEEALVHASACDPASPRAWHELGHLLRDQGRPAEACNAYAAAVRRAPADPRLGSSLLRAMSGRDDATRAEVFAAHCEWGRRHGRAGEPPPAFPNAPIIDRRLRVGYVSPDFRHHPAAQFLAPLMAAHDRARVEAVCYSDVVLEDEMTGRFRGHADRWRRIVGLPDDAVADLVRRDRIDILVDLSGHAGRHRLAVFARRPAPVQATWLGHADTTGLPEIGWRITDDIADPLGDSEAFATETLLRLPGGFHCYAPLDEAPAPEEPPSATSGTVAFGAFGDSAQIAAATVTLWSRVLEAVPGSRLVLRCPHLHDEATRMRHIAAYITAGVDPGRIAVLPAAADRLLDHRAIDIALDPSLCNAAALTCEALWMGVPVVTLYGDRHAARVGASLLRQVGLESLVARDADAYVAAARRLATDGSLLARLRGSLRQRMRRADLGDAERFARKIEAAYRRIWADWCAASTR